MKRLFISLFALLSVNLYSLDFTAVECHVTLLEATYMPHEITFYVDEPSLSGWIHYTNSDPEKVKAFYSTLLTALVSGNKVRLYGNNQVVNGVTTHYLMFLHILAN